MDEELRRFAWKVEGGAEYVVTQPVFDLNLIEEFMRNTAAYGLPIIAGIWPLTSYRNAEFMVNELRVPVPEEYMARMRRGWTRPKKRGPKESPLHGIWCSGCARWSRVCNSARRSDDTKWRFRLPKPSGKQEN